MKTSIELLKLLLPEFRELISEIEQSNGYLNFSTRFAEKIIGNNLLPWSQFYLDENLLKSIFFLAWSES